LPLTDAGVAVVTGGATGIGAALARRLAARGQLCVLLGRREERLRELAGEIEAEYEVCDVADRDAVERAAAEVRMRHPAIGLLVNNAGIPGRIGFLDAPPERIEELVRINYLGSVWCLRAFLPALEAAAPAHVVNVVSVAGTVAVGPYSASKHAQLAFSRSVAAELRPRDIRVLTVNPGFVDTEGFPQQRLRERGLGRIVVGADYVAGRIVQALERGRTEIFVPGWYRAAAWGQSAAPAAAARLTGRRRARRAR
jgi:short-subunit dehydrogenase